MQKLQQVPWLGSVDLSESHSPQSLHATHSDAQVARDLAQTDGGICTNPRLLIVCCLGKVSQEFAVDYSVRKLWHHRKDCSDRLLTDYRCHIAEASDLCTSVFDKG